MMFFLVKSMIRLNLKFLFTVILSSTLLISSNYINKINADELRPTEVQESCRIRVGMVDWLPYQYFTDKGVAAGLQIELIEKIAKLAGCKFIYQHSKPADSLLELEIGQLDMLLNTTVTPDRKKYAYFSNSYRNEMLVLYSIPQFTEDCSKLSLAQLVKKGFRLGLQTNSVYGDVVTKVQQQPELNKKIHYLDHTIASVAFVKQHGLDGVIADPVNVSYKARKEGYVDALQACRVAVQSSPVSFMFSQKTMSQQIVSRFNRAIEQIKQTDYYKKSWVW